MNVFLAKSEPSDYSIDDLERDTQTLWDGVHNRQAINVIKTWDIGDIVLIYHSMGQAQIVGIAQVISKPFENKDDPRYSVVSHIQYIDTIPQEERISLKEIKQTGLFNDFSLVKQSRLSTMKCPDNFVQWLAHNCPTFKEVYSKQ